MVTRLGSPGTPSPPVLPNTRQFLTISKVILLLHGGPLAPAAWGAKPKLEESYGNKLELDTSHWKCLACAATSLAPAPQAAEYEMQWITVMPISILDAMWYDAVYREGPGYHRSSSLNISKVARDKATQNHQVLGVFVHNKAIIHNF